MVDRVEIECCTGCKMCEQICPVSAISFEADQEGFWYPSVNYDKCVQCGKCIGLCPPFSGVDKRLENDPSPKVFAAWSKDESLRLNSTSGAIYGELARYVFEHGGWVAGVVFDENFDAKHIVTNNQQDFDRLIRSKYFQSDTQDIYSQVRKLLEQGEFVLFSGTPCQNAALINFLGKRYDNLLSCDFICRGNLSPKAFRKYKQMLERDAGSKLKELHFKNKTKGWNTFGTRAVFENGKEYYQDRYSDLYVLAYVHHNLFLRPSCLKCKFKTLPRIADISFGDFWEVAQNVDPSLDDNKGTSVLMANNKKAMHFIEQIRDRLALYPTTVECVYEGNRCLFESAKRGEKRDIVFKNIDKYDFDVLIKKFTTPSRVKLLKNRIINGVKCLLRK